MMRRGGNKTKTRLLQLIVGTLLCFPTVYLHLM